MTYAVIPAKDFNGAKQRLSPFLHPQERRHLARAMLTDTLTACVAATTLEGLGVVTCDPDVARVAESCGAEVLWEPHAGGQSQAVTFAVQTCLKRGIDSLLAIPGDVPLITAADVEAAARSPQPEVPVVLVPNRDELGTNAVRLSPPDCMPLRFGYDSFRRHLRLATERHLTLEVRRLPRLALDIDEPADLALFVSHRHPSHSLQALTELGVVERLAHLTRPETYESLHEAT